MKTLIFWFAMVAATVQTTTAQWNNENITKYGIELSQFSSGSGFQPGYEAHFTVQPTEKAKVGFGIFVDNETRKFSGISITHQRMLMTGRSKLPLIQPYVFYNFIYRKTNIPEITENMDVTSNGNYVTYSSMEHHLGMGLNFNLSHIVLNMGLGYGIYLGSIKRPSAPDPVTREISGSNGSALIFKTGIGFRF